MRKITLIELVGLCQAAQGKLEKIYLHWTAGHYENLCADYHLNITGKGELYLSTEALTTVLAHTWRRNTGAIGLALCCCFDATIQVDGEFDLGSEPPTQLQLEVAAQVLALLTRELKIPLDADHVLTHAEIADLDGYGPAVRGTADFEKWDLWQLWDYDGQWHFGGDVLRGKAAWYSEHGQEKLPEKILPKK
ncbi:MAG: N-acetylmuramoyl-L-alanine amidase [Acidaminococcaceae bacterium]